MKQIVIIAGKKSHGPNDNGIHDYPAQVRLLAGCLRREYGDAIAIEPVYDDTWPSASIAAADCLVVISDGGDGDKFAPASQLSTPERRAEIDALCARGGGLVVVHFSLFTPEALEPWMLERCGGCFAWEKDGQRDWHSRIGWASGLLDRCGEHPLLRGVGTKAPLHEEYYHRLRFHPDVVPLIRQRALEGTGDEQHVAWCLERADGGRSFGTSMGHSLDSFRHDGLRALTLNAIAWCAGLELPAEGIRQPFVEREAIAAELDGAADPGPIRVAVLAGNAAHRWHNWAESTGALLRAWGDDPRITARVHTDPADLATALEDRDVLVLNWVNWEDPAGMPEAAKAGILAFLARGGGLFVHHFAGGACHPSLRGAAEGDWPEYRSLVRRVWEHRDIAPGPSGHDRYGTFTCQANGQHPLTAGIGRFEVEDELYFRQHGEQPIEPLMHARSNRTGADEPLLWTYDHGQARVVQCLLGHSAKTYDTPQARVLARRIVAWCARRALHGPADGP